MSSDPFSRPIPMQSLTSETGQWGWNRPPQFAKVEDFVDSVEKKLSNKRAKEDILDMFIIGATVEDVVNTLSISAVTQGKITPDAAELSKQAAMQKAEEKEEGFMKMEKKDASTV